MKKYFVFSDVHSFYDKLMEALEEKGFEIDNPDHIIISCGDLFDRGEQSKECLTFVVDMLKKGRAICIRGNHEDLMEEVFIREYFRGHDIHNGTDKTFKQLTELDPETTSIDRIIQDVRRDEALNFYLENCKDYYELGDNIFVHGWIPYTQKASRNETYTWYVEPIYKEDWREAEYQYWSYARWVNGMSYWHQGVREPGKTIWCGHWNASWGHSHLHDDGKEWLEKVETSYIDPDTGKQWPYVRHDTFVDDGIRALDATTVLSGKVNVEVIEL